MNNKKPKVDIIGLKYSVEGEKRQHLPISIKWRCPTCGYQRIDLLSTGNNYVSNPPLVSPNYTGDDGLAHYYLNCHTCDSEWTLYLQVNVSVKIDRIE